MGRRVLLVSASMGDGHDAAARELARRLQLQGDDPYVVDLLQCLPLTTGAALRRLYHGMLRYAPWLYDTVYRHVLDASPGACVTPDPVARLAAPRVHAEIARLQPQAVVALWHVAAQVTGQLRAEGRLVAPATVVVTEPAVTQSWVHLGNDRHVCVTDASAAEAAARGAREPLTAAPLVGPSYHCGLPASGLPDDVASRLDGRQPVLLVAGAWGAGEVVQTARSIAASGRHAAVVLCGRNARLTARLAGEPGVVALGGRDDVPRLLAGSSVVVQNGGGLACWEALALGRPVLTFLPLPGHGRAAAQRLADQGLVPWARDQSALLDLLDELPRRPAPRLDLTSMPDAADLVAG